MKTENPKNARLTIPAELKDQLAVEAEKMGMTTDECAIYILQSYLTELEIIAEYKQKKAAASQQETATGLPQNYDDYPSTFEGISQPKPTDEGMPQTYPPSAFSYFRPRPDEVE